MSLDDPRLQSLLKKERSDALLIGFGGLVAFAAGVLVIVANFIEGESLGKQLESGALGLVFIALGLLGMYGALRHRPEDKDALRWITTERDKVRGWRILPGSGVGAMNTKIILVAHKGEDEVLVLVRGKEEPVLSYLTEHFPRLDG